MSDEESEHEVTPAKRRRRVTKEDSYKRNIIRTARVKGEGYVSYSGKQVSEKNKPANVTCKCTLKCSQKIQAQTVETIWTNFYSLENKNTQDTYLQTLVEANEVRRRRKKRDLSEGDGDESSKRNHTFSYNLKIDGSLKRVCKNVFMQIHGVSHNRLARICSLLVSNITPKDKRGLNRSGNAIPGNICLLIHDHISKFEVKETHYGDVHIKYLDARLNLKSMYQMFMKDHPNLESVVKYNFYYMYFRENFGYRFGRPQVDVCSTCENLKCKLKDKVLNDNAKRAVAGELIVHKRRASKFYKGIQDAAKNNDEDTVILCFDYMQNLPLPNIPVQEIFYMRQLWVNVFGIHDVKTGKAKLYLYHEGEANKSPDEVCSFLLDYINEEVPASVRKLILFSDGPSGQNKNHTMVRFLMNLCDNGRFDSIIHNFPVRGHSFSPCDRDFGPIKRMVKQVDRIYTPEEYMELILRASKTNRFSVKKVTPELILDFKKWWPRFYKKLALSDETSGRNVRKEDKETFKVSTYKQFCYNKDTPGKVIAKQYIDGFVQATFSLLKVDHPPPLPTESAYPAGKVPINVKKIADLKKLKDYLVGYEGFYCPIFEWPTTDQECNIELVYE